MPLSSPKPNENYDQLSVKLKESEEKFRHFIKLLPVPLCHVDNTTGDIKYFNDRFSEIFKYTYEDIPTLAEWWQLAYPDDEYRKWVMQNWTEAVETAAKTDTDIKADTYKVTCKDGSERMVIISGITIGNDFLATFNDITERYHAEQALHENEAKFRSIFENSPLGKSMTGIDGSLNMNKRFCEILGYSDKELREKNWKEITYPDDIQESVDVVQSLLDGKRIHVHYEKRYIHKNGHIVWTDVNTTLQRGNDGKPLYFITTIADITGRKKTEQTLKEQEEKFRTLFDAEPDAIVTADPATGILLEANKAASRLFGRPAEDLVGLHQTMLHPPEMRGNVTEKFREIAIEGSQKPQEIVVQNADGKVIPAEVVGSVAELGGKPVAIGIFRDISERKKTEQEILREKTIAESTIDAVPGVFYQISSEGRFVRWNTQFQNISKYSSAEIAEMHPLDLFKETDKEKVGTAIQAVFTDGYADVEADFISKDGTATPHLLTGKLFTIDDIPYLIGMGIDISDLKKIEANLRKTNAELETFNKMAVGREKRMIALKQTINHLSEELGKKPPYDTNFAEN